MKLLKNILSQLHTFVLWLLMSAMFWGWMFAFVTDTSPDKKVSLYCDVPEIQDVALAEALEARLPEGIRMIQVHSFEYVMFDTDAISKGDIFLLPASQVENFAEDMLPVGEENGVKVYDAATGVGVALEYIQYGNEDYYLFLGGGSVHLEDGKALEVALALLSMGS